MPIRPLVVYLVLSLFVCGVTAQQQEAQQKATKQGASTSNQESAFVGTWEGYWQGRAQFDKGKLFVTLTEDQGRLQGTLVALETGTFGADPKPLEKIRVSGEALSFSALSAASHYGTFDAEVSMSRDGKLLEGVGSYRGVQYKLLLKRN